MKDKSTPKPSAEHRQLEAFIGKWKTEGMIHKTPLSPGGKLIGTDIYEWLPGNFFLVHRVDAQVGTQKNESLEIIGYDAESKHYTMYAFDNQGNRTPMQARLEDKIWKFTGETMRFSGTFSEDGNTITGKWELLHEGNWLLWMDITLARS